MRSTLAALIFLLFVGCSAPKMTPIEAISGTMGATRVLVFTAIDCPIANAYAPELARLAALAQRQGVTMILVYPDSTTSIEEALRHAREYAIPLPVCCDPTHQLVRATGATVTPEAAVVRLDGTGAFEVLYRGRIDNNWVGIGQRRIQATTCDLRDAIIAASEGRPPKPARTQAIGCTIEPIPESSGQ